MPAAKEMFIIKNRQLCGEGRVGVGFSYVLVLWINTYM